MQQMSKIHTNTLFHTFYMYVLWVSDTWTGKRRTERGERKQEEKKGVITVMEDEDREEVGRLGGTRRKTGGDEVKRREMERKIMEEKGRWRDSEGESEGGLDARGGWERYKHWGGAARRDVEKQMGLLWKRERKDERGGGQLQRSKPSWCLAWHKLCQHNNVSRKPGWQTTGMSVQRGKERKGGGVRDGRQEKRVSEVMQGHTEEKEGSCLIKAEGGQSTAPRNCRGTQQVLW